MKQLVIVFSVILLTFASCQNNTNISIFCIGDSTMANKAKEAYPEHGWCMVINNYFDESVTVKNHAKNGRSSKSFIDEGRWQTVLDSLKKGDFVFIQFGHNDQKDYDSTRYTTPFDTYSDNLRKLVKQSRAKGATPILFTSIVRRKFDKNGKLTDTHGDYPVATRKVAQELNVHLIDLQQLTEKWINDLGDEPSKAMYVWTDILTERFKQPRKDDTHLSVEGANKVAQLATCAIQETVPTLGKQVK